jgi:oligosaccharyltransferase complex subunit delta (ribophorin II)
VKLAYVGVQSQKDLPSQFLKSSKPISANIVIGSFGSSKAYNERAFNLEVEVDASAPVPASESPLRYGKLPEIHHIFRPDPKSPPKIITIFFTAVVLATIPVLLGTVSLCFLTPAKTTR